MNQSTNKTSTHGFQISDFCRCTTELGPYQIRTSRNTSSKMYAKSKSMYGSTGSCHPVVLPRVHLLEPPLRSRDV